MITTTMNKLIVLLLCLFQTWSVVDSSSSSTLSSLLHQGKPKSKTSGSVTATMMMTPSSSFAFVNGRRRSKLSTRAETALFSATASMDALISLRGGEMAASDDDDEEEDNSPLLSSLRSAIRNLLDFGDSTVPVISSIFRPCVRIMEKLTGVSLLPDIKVKVKKSSKKGKKKSSKKKSSIDDEEDGDADAVEAKKEKKVKSASKALKKPSVTTQKHVSGKLKSTNPNYRIQKELKEFIQSPPPNLSVQVGSNMRAWVVTMVGANNTVYEGEVFKLRINFPKDYPTVPPSVYFLKGYIPTHEHVYTNGDICLSLLGKDWRPTMTAQSIAVSILSILSSAQSKSLPMDNAAHAGAKPGEYQKDWVYHDDNC